MRPLRRTRRPCLTASLPSSASHRLALVNIAVAALVVVLKYAAYHATGSVALYSDALESLVNIATALIAAVALSLAARPPDRHHQFGHQKAEYFAAVVEGVLIVIAAGLIIRAALAALGQPSRMHLTAAGFGFSFAATAINGAWAAHLIRRGRAMRSLALVADGWHLVTDVATSVAVLVGLLLVAATGWQALDAVMAIAVAVYILWAGGRLIRQSVSGLMDEAVTSEVARQIRAAISGHGEGALQAHDLKTRISGSATFVEFHLVVPGRMTVADAHVICDRIEDALKAAVPGSEVLIHVEPEGEARKTGVVPI
jgi:cation diffusion facilitator family transporter